MAVIRDYDAPEARITPSEAGASTLARAGTEETRMGMQAANSTRQAGTAIGSGMRSLGGAITNYEERAQAHADTLAEVDFQNSLAQSEIAAIGGVTKAATPIDENGDPIENTPGRGGSQSLPPSASVPSPGSFAKATSSVIEDHQQFGEDAVAKAAASGASQKMQDHIAGQVAESNRRLAVHAAALKGDVDATHLIHTTEQTTNTITSGIDRDPTQLDSSLKMIDSTIDAAQGSMTGNFAKEGAKKFEAAKQKAHADALTTAASSLARSGRVTEANALLDNLKYDTFLTGAQREAMKTHILALGNQADEDSARKDAAQQRKEFHVMDAQMGNAIKDYKPGDTMPDFRGDPNWIRHPEKAGQLEGVFRAHVDTVLHRNQPDPVVSYQNGEALKKELFDTTGSPDVVMNKARDAFSSSDPSKRIDQKTYDEIQKLYSDPNARSLGKSVNDWLTKEGEGKIDPKLGSGPLQGGRSLLGQQQVQAWKDAFNKRAKADPEHAHDLLDPSKPGNMVSPEALAPYRITESLKSQYKANQAKLDEQADAVRNPGGEPESTSVMDVIKRGLHGEWFSSGEGVTNDASAVTKIPGGGPFTPPVPAAAPATVKTIDDVQKLQPGAKFVIPDGPSKGKIGTVPPQASPADHSDAGTTPTKASFTTEASLDDKYKGTPFGVGFPGQNDAMGRAVHDVGPSQLGGLDAHTGKNLFSSGRAASMGIKGGVGQTVSVTTAGGHNMSVNAEAAPHFKAFVEDLERRGFHIASLGSLSDRNKRTSNTKSEHAYGNAIDINARGNEQNASGKDTMPANIGAIAAQYGLIWGGDWHGSTRDPMHFEWTGRQSQFAKL